MCWGVDCASPDKSKLGWKLHFLEWKSCSLEKKIIISERPFQRFITKFFLSFDLGLSCKLQLIDLMVSAACLAGWQTILVCFSRELWVCRKRKETNGWKIKNATGRFLVQIHPSCFVSKVVWPAPLFWLAWMIQFRSKLAAWNREVNTYYVITEKANVGKNVSEKKVSQ